MTGVDVAPDADATMTRRVRLGAALASAVVATLVSTIDIGRPAPWIDEAATLLAVRRPWSGLFALVQGADAPLVPYYAVLKLWLRLVSFAPALVGARMLSALAAGMSVGLLFLLVTRRTSWRPAAAGVIVLLAMPGFVRFAQEARPYALLGLMVTASWLAWSSHRWPPTRRAAVVCYPLTLAASVVTSLFGLFQWPAQAAAMITASRRTRRQLLALLVSFAVAGMLAIVPAAAAVRRGTGPREIGPTGVVDQLSTLAQAVEVDPGHWGLAVVVCALALVGFVAAVRGNHSDERELAVMAAWWLLAPTALSLAVVYWHPGLLRARYFVPALVPLAILAGLGIVAAAQWGHRRGRIGARGVAAVLLGGVIALGLPTQVQIRAEDGHDVLTPLVLGVIDTEVAAHPQARLFVGGHLSAILVVERPDLAARNVGAVVRSGSRQLWPAPPHRADFRAAMSDAHDVVWVVDTGDPMSPPPGRPPSRLRRDGFAVTSVQQVGPWFVALLRR